MNIGVDAYYLHAEHIDGLGNYLLRLLKELSRMDTVNEYFLYTPGVVQDEYARAIFENPRFKLRTVPGIFPGKRRLWLQSPSLHRQIIDDRVRFFFAGAEYFPLFLPRDIFIATTIHDVAYKAIPDAISFSNTVFYRVLFPFFVKRSDRFFTVSHYSKKEMVDYLGIDTADIRVIYNGIDFKNFGPLKNKDKKKYILFVGTLQPRKNLENLIRAFVEVSDKIDDSLVIVGGSGWKNSHLRRLIDGLDDSLKKRIIFKGYVAGNDLARLYREAALFALPSLHEGFCLPILEAMASGTAVLTSSSTAIPEVFGDSVEYRDPYSPGDIGSGIYELLTNAKKRDTFMKKGLSLSQKYSVSSQAAQYMDAFNQISASLKTKSGLP